MLPMPATYDWSSKKSFKGRFDAASNWASWPEVKSRERASMPRTLSPEQSSPDSQKWTRPKWRRSAKPRTPLSRLPRGDEHDGFIPVFGIADEAHRRAVSLRSEEHTSEL